MKPVIRLRFCVCALSLAATLLALNSGPARAELVYDNSDTGGTNVHYALVEYGDEVILTGTSRVVSEFLFEYYGEFTVAGDETARLRIYRNDGPNTPEGDPTPGTVLFDSGAFNISPGYQTKKFSGLNVTVPTDLTWTIEFGGLTGTTGDRAGLVLRDPPSVGTSYDDFWQKSQGRWQLFSWDGKPLANFAARIFTGAEPTRVSIRREPNKVVVEWTGLSVLQTADSINGEFKDLPNARNRYEINPAAAQMKFWRLRD
jgi:hypothetical protein